MPHFRLIGGHSAGRFVMLDDPLPVELRVAFRVPAEPFEPDALANESPDSPTFGIDIYDLVIFPRGGKGQGPTARQYVYVDTVREPPAVPRWSWRPHA